MSSVAASAAQPLAYPDIELLRGISPFQYSESEKKSRALRKLTPNAVEEFIVRKEKLIKMSITTLEKSLLEFKTIARESEVADVDKLFSNLHRLKDIYNSFTRHYCTFKQNSTELLHVTNDPDLKAERRRRYESWSLDFIDSMKGCYDHFKGLVKKVPPDYSPPTEQSAPAAREQSPMEHDNTVIAPTHTSTPFPKPFDRQSQHTRANSKRTRTKSSSGSSSTLSSATRRRLDEERITREMQEMELERKIREREREIQGEARRRQEEVRQKQAEIEEETRRKQEEIDHERRMLKKKTELANKRAEREAIDQEERDRVRRDLDLEEGNMIGEFFDSFNWNRDDPQNADRIDGEFRPIVTEPITSQPATTSVVTTSAFQVVSSAQPSSAPPPPVQPPAPLPATNLPSTEVTTTSTYVGNMRPVMSNLPPASSRPPIPPPPPPAPYRGGELPRFGA